MIAVLCNYTWQTSNYQHNEANYYSACERRMSREHGGNLLPLLRWWMQLPLPSLPKKKKKNVCQTPSVIQHKQQQEVLKWQTNLSADSEALRMGGSPLAITFLQSGDSWSCRRTQASLSLYLAVSLDCGWRTPGSGVQIVQSKHTHTHAHTHTHSPLWK